MIRKNYSLNDDLRKQEKRKQGAIQQRQKRQFLLDRAKDTDPIRLYRRLERLKHDASSDRKLVARLEEEWSFIQKNGLHKEKLDPFLKRIREEKERQEVQRSKLWGSKSVYFNPELNPLGKVPKSNAKEMLPNLTVPLRNKKLPPKDDRIPKMDIPLPPGEPPKYYNLVQNTGDHYTKSIESVSTNLELLVPTQMLKKRVEMAPEEEEYKRRKVGEEHIS